MDSGITSHMNPKFDLVNNRVLCYFYILLYNDSIVELDIKVTKFVNCMTDTGRKEVNL